MAYLIIINGLDQGQLFELSTGQNFLGRDEDADIQNRLWSIGLKRKILFLTKKQYLYHNPHPKSKRVENYQNKNMSKSHRNNELIGEKWRDDLDDWGYYR